MFDYNPYRPPYNGYPQAQGNYPQAFPQRYPQQQMQMPVNNIVKGRVVTGIEEARAAQVDLDGTPSYFPSLGEGKIYVKYIGMDGLPVTLNALYWSMALSALLTVALSLQFLRLRLRRLWNLRD